MCDMYKCVYCICVHSQQKVLFNTINIIEWLVMTHQIGQQPLSFDTELLISFIKNTSNFLDITMHDYFKLYNQGCVR